MNVSFAYDDLGKSIYGHIYRPVVKVKLQSPDSKHQLNVWMIVDTGADYTILPRDYSQKLRISLEKDCTKDTTLGVGGGQIVYFCKNKIHASIGQMARDIPLAFFDNNEVPALMGRLGFLETFNIAFSKNHKTTFKDWSVSTWKFWNCRRPWANDSESKGRRLQRS